MKRSKPVTMDDRKRMHPWLLPHLIRMENVRINGRQYRYAVVSAGFNPELIGFIGSYQDQKDGKTIQFFVSEEVPRYFRRYLIIHEVRCTGSKRKNACLNALVYELRQVPAKLRDRYITYCRRFFQRLETFNAQHGLETTPEGLMSAACSAYLQRTDTNHASAKMRVPRGHLRTQHRISHHP